MLRVFALRIKKKKQVLRIDPGEHVKDNTDNCGNTGEADKLWEKRTLPAVERPNKLLMQINPRLDLVSKSITRIPADLKITLIILTSFTIIG